MKERDNYMLCCDCGLAAKKSKMFIKKYQNTAICLCKKCALKLYTEGLHNHSDYRNYQILPLFVHGNTEALH